MTSDDDDGPILFAYDGSEPAKASIREAGRQLRSGRAAIVVTVWQLPGEEPMPEDVEADMEADARHVALEGADLARAAGFAAEPLALAGDKVWRDIVGAADEHDASLVVLGAHARSGIALAILGSVATAVTRHARRPVLVVHPR